MIQLLSRVQLHHFRSSPSHSLDVYTLWQLAVALLTGFDEPEELTLFSTIRLYSQNGKNLIYFSPIGKVRVYCRNAKKVFLSFKYK